MLWIILVLVAASFGAGGWYIHRIRNSLTPRFDFLLISVNGEPRKIPPGATLSLHPTDRAKILDVSTNVPINYGIRLFADKFDAEALRYEEMKLSTWIGDAEVFNRHVWRVRVKYKNTELGFTDWEIQPFPEDWVDRADAITNPSERAAFLERAIQLMPDNAVIWRKLLEDRRAAGQWEKAAAMLEDEYSRRPDRALLKELLDVYRAVPKDEGVVSVLKRIIETNPGDAAARAELAELTEKAGDREEAVRQYEALLKRGVREDELALCKHLAYLYTESGKWEKAVSYYLKAAELDKTDANIFYNLSYLYEKLGQKKDSEIYLGKALRLQPGDTESRLKLARKFIQAGRSKEAQQYLQEVLEKEPRSISALAMTAEIMERESNKKELIQVYEKMAAIEPKNDTVAYNLGTLYYEAGNLERSLLHFRKYLEFRPDDAAVHKTLFDIYLKQNNSSLAFKQAQILIQSRPKEPDSYRYVFRYLTSTGEYAKMIPLMKSGVEKNPESAELRRYLIVAYLKTGEEKPAMDQMEAVLGLNPRDADLWLDLARLREKNGMLEKAMEAYSRVLAISPENEEAQAAYLELRLRGIEGGGKR